jgi:8-oxo-dGTP pyrophosphatase MutT (NUDIX family)
MSNAPVKVAIAILRQNGKFLLQLRDNIPTIVYPGHWAFFGGHLEPGEDDYTGVQRELLEEIGYSPPSLIYFGCYADAQAIRHVYQGELEISVEKLVLTEGVDLDLVPPEEIERGEHYSQKIQQLCPLAPPHRQILLDFIANPTPRQRAES